MTLRQELNFIIKYINYGADNADSNVLEVPKPEVKKRIKRTDSLSGM